MDSILKHCAGSTRKLLLTLLFVAVMQNVVLHKAEAATANYNMTSSGELTLSFNLINPVTSPLPPPTSFIVYKNTYPATSSVAGSGSSGGSYPGTVKDFISSVMGGTISSTTQTATYNFESTFGYLGDGNYWAKLTAQGVTDEWYTFTRSGGVWTTENLIFSDTSVNTRLVSGSVTGTASSTDINVNYYLDTNEFTDSNRPDTLEVTITSLDSTQIAEKKKLILPLVTGNSSSTVNITPTNYTGVYATSSQIADGTYSAWVKFWNFSLGNFVFPTSLTFNFVISGGVVTSYTEVAQTDGLMPLQGYVYQPCGITDIGGCISNAVAGLFYPSEESLDSFTATYETLSGKFPFAYMTDFRDSITQIYTSSTTASATITVPFGTFGNITLLSAGLISTVPFASTIRTLLGALIWIMLAAQVWRRAQTIFNQKTA